MDGGVGVRQMCLLHMEQTRSSATFVLISQLISSSREIKCFSIKYQVRECKMFCKSKSLIARTQLIIVARIVLVMGVFSISPADYVGQLIMPITRLHSASRASTMHSSILGTISVILLQYVLIIVVARFNLIGLVSLQTAMISLTIFLKKQC
jgi:hypothetical protein